MKSGAAASVRKPYVYFEQLRFLEPTCCNTQSNIEEDLPDEQEDRDLVEQVEHESQNPEPKYPQPSRSKKRKKEEDLLLEVLTKKIVNKNSASSKESEDADTMFLLSLLPELKKFPENQKLFVKSQLLNTILHLQSNLHLSSIPGPSLPQYNHHSFTPHVPNQYYPPQPGPYQNIQQNQQQSSPGPSSQGIPQLTTLTTQGSSQPQISPSASESTNESETFNFWNIS